MFEFLLTKDGLKFNHKYRSIDSNILKASLNIFICNQKERNLNKITIEFNLHLSIIYPILTYQNLMIRT